MYCNKCGSQLDDGAKFCQNCGSPVKKMGNTDVSNKNIDRVPLRNLGIIILIISICALFAVPDMYRRDWSFKYQWGSTFYMFDLAIIILGIILIVVGSLKK